jgi:hypothetical protein
VGSNVNLHASVQSSPSLRSSNQKKIDVTIESLDSDDEEKGEQNEVVDVEPQVDRESRLFSNSPLRNSLVTLLPRQFAYGKNYFSLFRLRWDDVSSLSLSSHSDKFLDLSVSNDELAIVYSDWRAIEQQVITAVLSEFIRNGAIGKNEVVPEIQRFSMKIRRVNSNICGVLIHPCCSKGDIGSAIWEGGGVVTDNSVVFSHFESEFKRETLLSARHRRKEVEIISLKKTVRKRNVLKMFIQEESTVTLHHIASAVSERGLFFPSLRWCSL